MSTLASSPLGSGPPSHGRQGTQLPLGLLVLKSGVKGIKSGVINWKQFSESRTRRRFLRTPLGTWEDLTGWRRCLSLVAFVALRLRPEQATRRVRGSLPFLTVAVQRSGKLVCGADAGPLTKPVPALLAGGELSLQSPPQSGGFLG